jgi:hypothetical protein
MVSAFRDDRRSVQMWRDFENTRSTETLVAGIAKKSLAMRAGVEKDCAFFWKQMSLVDRGLNITITIPCTMAEGC